MILRVDRLSAIGGYVSAYDVKERTSEYGSTTATTSIDCATTATTTTATYKNK